MKLKTFQKQDLARAALHDGLILAWDTGLGKTWALYLWALLKVGHTTEPAGHARFLTPQGGRTCAPNSQRIRPRKPVLIIAPGDLHQQIANEGWEVFGIVVRPLDSQATFERLTCGLHSAQTRLDHAGRPVLEPDFYITSYTQLTTNGVEHIPDVRKWADPVALRQRLCLKDGDHVGLEAPAAYCAEHGIRWPDWKQRRPPFATTCEFFAWREVCWRDEYLTFNTNAHEATRESIRLEHERQKERLDGYANQEAAGEQRAKLQAKYDVLQMLVTDQPNPRLRDLNARQQEFVLKHFLHCWLLDGAANEGALRRYEKLSDGKWRPVEPGDRQTPVPAPDDPVVVATWQIKCVYSPSLSDLAYNAFDAVVIDEGVKMKGADTYVGLGVRQMDPAYRLVLTATPIKNRVPDLFWLAHWATGGRAQAHARFPYSNDPGEQGKFAETFMVSEQNLSRTADAAEKGKSSKRFTKLTAEVCNVHRLWKLLGPIVLRRRKDDCGEDIVPKIRRVVRCKMGTLQSKVYQYHLNATYLDKNDDDALGARLQSLRQAAADPTCELPQKHLTPQDCPAEDCRCTRQPVPPEEQLRRLHERRQETESSLTGLKPDQVQEKQNTLAAIDHEIAHPVPRFDKRDPDQDCPHCGGAGTLPLPCRSDIAFIPKHASVLNLVQEILERGEQVVVGAAFNSPLDVLSGYLDQAGVRHLKLDGRTSQKKRGQLAARFKRGRHAAAGADASVPVLLAGVECMAEGHSFHLANNVILLAYSWAYDKFIQFINRVHRMTSPWPVNVYVVVCDGTIDLRLESLVGEKGDSSELVLDGRLIGERTEEVNLADLLKVAHREFDANSDTIDEALIHAQWPVLQDQLRRAQSRWDAGAPVIAAPAKPAAPVRRTTPRAAEPAKPAAARSTSKLRYNPDTGRYTVVTTEPLAELPPPPPPPAPGAAGGKATSGKAEGGRTETVPAWRAALRCRAARPMLVSSNNPWDNL